MIASRSALVRGGLAVASLLSLLAVAPAAQNGSGYHVLSNGPDAIFVGVGAGGNQTDADGIGTWVPGEDLKGPYLTGFGAAGSDFAARMKSFREFVCITAPSPTGTNAVRFPSLLFLEFDGDSAGGTLHGHSQPIFLDPTCALGLGSFVPYGTGPSSSVSFLVAQVLGSVAPGLPSTLRLIIPDHGVLGGTGQIDIVAAAGNVVVPLPAGSFALGCWGVQFTWLPSAIAFVDDIDGLWHWATTSPDGNQYWAMSDDEQNLWQSQTIVSDGSVTAAQQFLANVDYAFLMESPYPSTTATLLPLSSGPYATQTANVGDEFGASLNPNGGFDAGRGSHALSLSGTGGVTNPVTGLGNQDPGSTGLAPTLGFATWEGNFSTGSVRLTWVSADLLGLSGGNPDLDPGIALLGGSVRVPVVSAGFFQPVTGLGFSFFGHVTAPGWPDPSGLPTGFPGSGVGGASNQIPLAPLPAVCTGMAFNLTYGSSGRLGGLGTPGAPVWDPALVGTSGTKQLFLFN